MQRCKRSSPSLGAQQRAMGGWYRRGFALPPRRERSGAAPAPPSAFPPLLILRIQRFPSAAARPAAHARALASPMPAGSDAAPAASGAKRKEAAASGAPLTTTRRALLP